MWDKECVCVGHCGLHMLRCGLNFLRNMYKLCTSMTALINSVILAAFLFGNILV